MSQQKIFICAKHKDFGKPEFIWQARIFNFSMPNLNCGLCSKIHWQCHINTDCSDVPFQFVLRVFGGKMNQKKQLNLKWWNAIHNLNNFVKKIQHCLSCALCALFKQNQKSKLLIQKCQMICASKSNAKSCGCPFAHKWHVISHSIQTWLFQKLSQESFLLFISLKKHGTSTMFAGSLRLLV